MKHQLLSIALLILLLYGCTKDNTPIQPPPPAGKSWENLSSMPTARHDFGFVECNNLLYAIGGYNANGLNTVEVYDPATNKWTTKKPMPTARAYLAVAAVSNKIYAIGGITGGDLNNITYIYGTEEYDPATDTWTEKTPIPISIVPFNYVLGNFFMTGAAVNGKIYVAAGSSDEDLPTYIYDPSTDTWTTGKSNSKFNLQPYYSVGSGSNLYITNGDHLLQYLSDKDEWRELPLPSVSDKGWIYNSCLASYNDAIYSIGGWLYGTDTSKDLSNVQHYDAVNSKWIKDTSLNTARNAAAAVVYKDKLYVLGGSAVQSNYTNIPISNLESYPLK